MELKDLLTQLQPIIFMLIASKVDHGTHLVLLTLLPLFLPMLHTLYTKYTTSCTATVTVKSRSQKGIVTNCDALDSVSARLISSTKKISALLIPKSTLEYIEQESERQKYVDTYRPKSFPIPNGTFPFVYRGFPCMATIEIAHEDKVETTTIKLSSTRCTTQVLHEFVQEAIDEKWERDNLRKDKEYVQRVYTFSNADDAWCMNKLTVQKTFQNVYLRVQLQREIESDVDAFMQKEQLYKQQGIPHKRGFLFYGPPGTGKTSCIYALAHKLKCGIRVLSLKTTESIKERLMGIKESCIILLEEVDIQLKCATISSNMMGKNKSNKSEKKCNDDRLLSDLMDVLDGYGCDLQKCIIIMTTNHKEDIPDALIRPGRIDKHFYFAPCDAKEAARVARQFTGFDDLPEPKKADLLITSAELINRVLLPNVDDHETLSQEMLQLCPHSDQCKIHDCQ